jgi:DNA polymerase V
MTWPLDARLLVRRIDAGFPSPAEEWRELELNVHELLVPRPASTFFFCVSGSSMQGAGIHDGDLLIVDRMLTAQHNSIIIALLDGKATVKRLQLRAGTIALKAEHPEYPLIKVTPRMAFQIWGVATYVVHPLTHTPQPWSLHP